MRPSPPVRSRRQLHPGNPKYARLPVPPRCPVRPAPARGSQVRAEAPSAAVGGRAAPGSRPGAIQAAFSGPPANFSKL